MKPIDIGLIQARRKKIEADIQNEHQRHERALSALEDELEELKVAERVFSKLTQGTPSNEKAGPENGHSAGGKPSGLPAVSEMIREALKHAIEVGAKGMKPAGLLSYIRGKYWPTAESRDVGPIAWRMWQSHQLEKFKDGEYTLPKSEREAIQQAIAKEAAKMPPPGQLQLNP